MQDQPIDVVGETDEQAEREVLALLVESTLPGPWSVWELGLQIGSDTRAVDAVMRLHADGLRRVRRARVRPARAAPQAHAAVASDATAHVAPATPSPSAPPTMLCPRGEL